MCGVLNALGAVILLLLLLLRRGFTDLFGTPQEARAPRYPYMRALIWVFGTAAIAFAALGLWALATGGYLPVAALLAFVLGSLVDVVRRKRPASPPA